MTGLDRAEALRDLLLLRQPVEKATSVLKSFPWDSHKQLVALTRADACNALDRYLDGHLSSEELEQWANAIEGRDDVGFEPGSEALLKDFVFQMAMPEITTAVTQAVAADWRDRLR